MKKKLYDILFPKKVDERIDVGSVIPLEAYTEYVVLGFEVCDWYCNVVAVKRDQYLKANPRLHDCCVGVEKMRFIKQLDKDEALSYYMKLKLMGLKLNLETRKQIKERSDNIVCKRKLSINWYEAGESFIRPTLTLLVIIVMILLTSLITKNFVLTFVAVVGLSVGIIIWFISFLSCFITEWVRIN